MTLNLRMPSAVLALESCPSRQCVQEFRETHLVGITHGGFAIRLDPFGMLDPQVVVNPLQELGVSGGFGES